MLAFRITLLLLSTAAFGLAASAVSAHKQAHGSGVVATGGTAPAR